jgi:thiol-disulfide isomerase/thioredoxin
MVFYQTFLNDKKKVLICICAFFVIVVLGHYLYKYINSYKKSNSLYKENIDDSINNSGPKSATVYFFYTTWCPYSLAAIPEWEKIVDKYTHNLVNGFSVKFIDIDCTKETTEIENLVNKYNIEGYPTIKMIKDDQVIDFDAKAKYNNIENFLVSVL